ncbi:hypothetical protein KI387_026029, partial [Taxus chinensis]
MSGSSTMDLAIPKALMDLHQSSPWFIIVSTAIASVLLLLISKRLRNGRGKKLPPGILGMPVVGETLQFLRAHKAHKSKEWIEQKVAKYGPVFKTSLMGSPTVVLTGQEGNRFLFHFDYNSIITKQPKAVREIVGKTNILELSGDEHKRIRGALMQFLKPEALQKLVGKMESAIKNHFDEFWEGNESVTVWPLMKKLTFQSACDLLLSLKDRNQREELRQNIIIAMKGMWSLPLDLPGMRFNKSLKARSRIIKILSSLLDVRRGELQQGHAFPRQDLLSSLLSMEDGNNNKVLSDEEITDNIIALLIAGHDTTAVLLTHMIRRLALHPDIYQSVLQEQLAILANKQPNEPLTWEDTQKMKYTWRVAQETSRLTPPLFGGFRKAIQDVEFGGYVIPKGWQ